MSLSVTIDAMLAAGCSAEQLAVVVKAHEAEREKVLLEKRANDAARQRKSRLSRDVTVTGRDTCDNDAKKVPPFSPLSLSPTPPNPNPPISPQKSQMGRGARLPNDWLPSLADTKFALDTGWTMEHVQIEAAKFRDYWTALPGQKGVKLDWPATWRNWVRRNLPSNHRNTAPPRKRTASDVIDEMLKELENERSETESHPGSIELFPANRIGR